uniref:Transposable element P transposase n=1 Tax=Heliothis virescens TaxID=7102 RepID=A0A2A4K3V7_HELVI
MTNSERICSVVVDSVSLKSSLFYNISLDKIIGLQEVNGVQSPILARQAVVVIIRGIFGNWQQPIGFALLGDCNNSGDISRWIEQLMERLIDVGLDIRTFISDLESDLLSEDKKKLISTERPYFFINNRKIFYIVDSLHLIKSLRNNLMGNDFHFHGSVAKYEHILQFYESEKNKSLKLAPKLSESHIKPSNFEKNQVRYATELLSHTVATAISCYIDFQAINGAAQDTVKLIKIINDLFDILNSSTAHSTCEYQQAFCGSATQITFMNEMLEFFKSLKLINSTTGRDVTSTAKFIRGYQITITSILLLFNDLTIEGYNNLLTRRLNQDVTNIFFGHVRSKRKRASTRQFMAAFRKIFFSNIIKTGKQGKSSGDLSQLLVNTEKLGVMLSAETEENVFEMDADCNGTNTEASTHSISTSDYNNMELPEDNKLRYISSYLFKKCVTLHGGCEQLKQSLLLDNKNETIKIDGLTNRDDTDVQLSPPDNFDNFVEEMER